MAGKRMMGAILGAALAAAVLVATGGPSVAAERIVISNWDAYMPPDLLQNFTKDTGIETELLTHPSNDEIVGKLIPLGGKGYDVVFLSSPYVEMLARLGLLAELDHGKIPNFTNLYPEAQDLGYDPGNRYSAPYSWGTTGLCYRSDVLKFEPSSWYDLLKPPPELDRRITMSKTERWIMAAGLKALGYSVNSTNPAELDAAQALLIGAKKSLLGYDDTTFYVKLVAGDADLVHAWDGWCNYGIAENDQIKFVVPKEGSDMWVDTITVMAASEHKEAAFTFINYILQPDVHRWVAENILYKVPNQKAMEALDPALFQQFPTLGMTPAELMQQELMRDIGDAQPEYSRRVTEILAAP